MRECCITGRRFRIKAKELYNAYTKWALDEGSGKPMSNTAFGRKMGKRFKRKKSGGMFYVGLKLKEPTETKSQDGLGW